MSLRLTTYSPARVGKALSGIGLLIITTEEWSSSMKATEDIL
jgi:hypothetical protein